MNHLDSFCSYVLEQLSAMPDIHCRRMFGGYGLYQADRFFGILYQGRLYFRTDTNTRQMYMQRGMDYFSPNARQSLKRYYAVPVEVIEDQDVLKAWAVQAIHAHE